MADKALITPDVLAHAINESATVGTKEEKITASLTKIKIPNVCDNMGVRWMNDFDFVNELGIQFTCSIK